MPKTSDKKSKVARVSLTDRSTSPEYMLEGSPTTIVAIGASAGGIEALGTLFDAMPVDSGCGFIVVLHLDPTHESEMAHILRSHTAMQVSQVVNGMRLVPNNVYVIAPDTELRVSGGILHVSSPSEQRGQRHPVDVLFSSAAIEYRERAIAIVLSGTGSNGTEGLREIRAQGGMSLVQSPETAKFDGMPKSAISAGMADQILPPQEMAEALLRYIRHEYTSDRPVEIETVSLQGEATIEQVLDLLRAHRGQDFSTYKRSTQRRRIHRRMGLRNIDTLNSYIDELRGNKDEITTLVADLMISVTGFFRDEEAWQTLSELVITPLVAVRQTGTSIRIWVPACSTGEEAYSIAMLVTEQAEAVGKRFDLKVFATDAQEENLRKARDGVYPAAAAADLGQDRLRRFFENIDSSYQVTKELRDMVVFAAQNLLSDPPFSRLDLVSCRNFLIYLEPEAQQKIIALCHFGLRQGGTLFLGNAETVGRHDDLFETLSKKWRIYRRIGSTRHDRIDYPSVRGSAEPHMRDEAISRADAADTSSAETARRALLERFAPASVLTDQRGHVLYFHGTTGDYLEQPSGEPTRDLLSMVRSGLSTKLRTAMRDASEGKSSVTVKTRIQRGGSSLSVDLTVTPLPASSTGGSHLLVSFVPASLAPASKDAVREPAGGEATAGERALQDELTTMRAELRSTIEHLETANEELKASNEEATSMNEELQSTNEELETSKEELQSFNEELNTVNNQLQHKIEELEGATNDLNNLLAGSETATLFLDDRFRVKWFAPATKELFDLVSSDIGRPIAHFARKFLDENLLSDAEMVLKKLTIIEAEVPSDTGRWYLRRMLPYRTRDNHIAGVVVTFSDITERKQSTDAVNEARVYSEAVVETIRQPLLVLDADLRVQSANAAFYEQFEVRQRETVGRLVFELGNGEWDIPDLRVVLDEVLSKGQRVIDFEVAHDFRDIGKRCMLLNATKLHRNGGRDDLILLAIEDITARRQGESAVRQSEQSLQDLIEALPGAVYTTDAAGLITSYNPAAVELWGRSPELGTDVWCGSLRMQWPDGTPLPHDECPMAIALKEGRSIRGQEAVAIRPDGILVPFLAFPTPLRDATGAVTGAVNMLVDITESKRAEALAGRLAAIVASSDDAIISKDLGGIITSWNQGAERLFGYNPDEIVGKSIMSLVPLDRQEEEAQILESIRQGEHVEHVETIRQRKDGSHVWVSLTISPLKNAHGKIIGASKIARDMTERRRADEHRKVLIGELNHRVKNILAVVQSIASQTLGHASTIEDARAAFGSRLINLANAHDLLTRENWVSADLGDIIADTVKPHSGGENNFSIEGPKFEVTPSIALAISMALHELSTNAVKYGALSTDRGQVTINWLFEGAGDDRRFIMRWEESGGPVVVPPTRRGFGSRLIERALAAELRGEVRVQYESSGVICTINAPMPAGHNSDGELDEQGPNGQGIDIGG